MMSPKCQRTNKYEVFSYKKLHYLAKFFLLTKNNGMRRLLELHRRRKLGCRRLGHDPLEVDATSHIVRYQVVCLVPGNRS